MFSRTHLKETLVPYPCTTLPPLTTSPTIKLCIYKSLSVSCIFITTPIPLHLILHLIPIHALTSLIIICLCPSQPIESTFLHLHLLHWSLHAFAFLSPCIIYTLFPYSYIHFIPIFSFPFISNLDTIISSHKYYSSTHLTRFLCIRDTINAGIGSSFLCKIHIAYFHMQYVIL